MKVSANLKDKKKITELGFCLFVCIFFFFFSMKRVSSLHTLTAPDYDQVQSLTEGRHRDAANFLVKRLLYILYIGNH